jgi:hypothetical protein
MLSLCDDPLERETVCNDKGQWGRRKMGVVPFVFRASRVKSTMLVWVGAVRTNAYHVCVCVCVCVCVGTLYWGLELPSRASARRDTVIGSGMTVPHYQ